MTRRLAGLAATLAIAALLVGVPALLWAIGGNPLTALPSLDQLTQALSRPDDGTLLLRLLWYAAWGGWLVLATLVLAEIAAAIRGIHMPMLPAIAPMQGAARALVATAALLFVAAPLLSLPAPPAHAAPVLDPAPVHTVTAAPTTPTTRTTAEPRTGRTTTYTVRDGDTLWGIAERFLGDGNRYPEIHQLNRTTIRNPNVIWAGMTLRIPAPPLASNGSKTAAPTVTATTGITRYTVKKGDTLSGIAQRLLGDPNRYPEIFDASRHITQPGGYRLTNPDEIDIGWTLHIPAPVTKAPKQPAPRQDNTQTPSAVDTAPPPTATAATSGSASAPTSAPASAPAPSTPPQQPTASAPTAAPPAPSSVPGQESDTTEAIDSEHAPWLLTGLSMGGAILAAGTLLALRRSTRQQYRARRPGRGIRTTDTHLAPVHRTVTAVGTPALPTLERLDEALRRTGPRLIADDLPFPLIDRVELSSDGVRLHLAASATAPAPWRADHNDPVWTLPADVDLSDIGPIPPHQPAPWPLLATLGTDGATTWLLNLEQASTISLGGDPTYAADYLRYLAGELAINPWAAAVTVYANGAIPSMEQLNPTRFSSDGAALALQTAQVTAERLMQYETTAPRARTQPPNGETWGATVLLASQETESAGVTKFTAVAGPRSASALVSLDTRYEAEVELTFTGSGRVQCGDLNLMAVGLTADEAAGCAALLAQADNTDDTEIPPAGDEGWRALANQAGAVRKELTTPRNGHSRNAEAAPTALPTTVGDLNPAPSPMSTTDGSSILPESDTTYLEETASVEHDLAELAPVVPAVVRKKVLGSDPTLDRDLDWWHSDRCPLPRLTLLGPVTVRAHGTPIAKRKPYYVEIIAYLALREHGATPEEVADAFGIAAPTARNAAKTVRDWLGTDPTTGEPHLPDADKSRAAKTRGTPTYQLNNILCDADLLRRLRLRGEASGGDGIADLDAALELVTGRPFDKLRPGGWNWLSPMGIDSHITCSIVDVAHISTVHHLAAGDTARARTAAETGALAAPDDTIPRLDLVAVARAEGHHAEALRMVRDEICNLADVDGIPLDLEARTRQIVDLLGSRGDVQTTS